MGSIGPAEIMVVLLVALIVLGPSRLPDAARSLGRAVGEFRRVASGFQDQVHDAFAGTEPAPSSAERGPGDEVPLVPSPRPDPSTLPGPPEPGGGPRAEPHELPPA